MVGRTKECELRIPNEMQTISATHLHFECEVDVGWTVMDTSTFGTILYQNWPLKKEKRVLVVPGLKLTIGRHHEKISFVVKFKKSDTRK